MVRPFIINKMLVDNKFDKFENVNGFPYPNQNSN